MVDGKRSSGASGELTLQQAIGQVLEGTGLQFRFTSLSAVLIFPADRPPGPAEAPWTAIESAPKLTLDTLTVTSSPTIGDSSRRRFEAFGSAIQGQIRHRLQTDVRTRRRTFQVRLSLTVDPSGRIRLLNIARSTGDVELDQHILDALAGVAFPQTPPADLPQPIWFDVASR
ncbi:TonB family C-terminal domain protein [Brevundimonas sp. BAL3]|nr:TonB family protein [Brevundimonas sp. BAL3]EDX80850.1 TonB family C-terminal domain protein [Brevundimonas sp. BAL3]